MWAGPRSPSPPRGSQCRRSSTLPPALPAGTLRWGGLGTPLGPPPADPPDPPFPPAATLDGGIGLLLPMQEKTYRRLLMLQNALSTMLPHHAGLNPRAFRYP